MNAFVYFFLIKNFEVASPDLSSFIKVLHSYSYNSDLALYPSAVNISTSIQLGFAVRREEKVKVAENSPACISFFPYFDGQELALFAGLNGGNAIHCFAESIAQWVSDLGEVRSTHPLFCCELPGLDGVIISIDFAGCFRSCLVLVVLSDPMF